ncbi:hypothetical protein AQUCO_00500055v1 [Aquilegia coerulea]|uniref:Uncharacterized protein n=1 Tax=Aquilegia coerulea TaxID=218851 RepID=A0A2G5EQ80_AQUCA|nr:hypothetical protein AQUCO_00500055v1 [Aquilegia coerulea]
MNRRIRTRSTKREDRYLKPGALAQIRDSKISARSQKPSLKTQIALYRLVTSSTNESTTTTTTTTQISMISNGFPCFGSRRFYNSPSCPQRKKLVASKSFYFSPSTPPTPDSPDSVMDVLNNTDFLVAH